MSTYWAWDGIVPVVDPTAFVHPNATVIGDVIIGPDCYVGAGAVLRGDFGRIVMKRGSNIQETCVCHSFPGKDVIVEENGHIGHGAVLHGCHVGKNAMVGMNAVIMDEATVGENVILGAGSFVRAGQAIPAGTMAVGSPARVIRDLTADEIHWKRLGTGVYQQLAAEAPVRMTPCEPAHTPEADRPRAQAPVYDPKILSKAKN